MEKTDDENLAKLARERQGTRHDLNIGANLPQCSEPCRPSRHDWRAAKSCHPDSRATHDARQFSLLRTNPVVPCMPYWPPKRFRIAWARRFTPIFGLSFRARS